MVVDYAYIKNALMNSLINHSINNSVSVNRSGNDSLPSQERWTRPWYLYALFIALIILSLSLNAVVIIACIRASLRKHPTNFYFLNLAIGDSGIALNMIIYLHNMDIPWTVATCKIAIFIQMFIAIFSWNTLLLVAVERFVAVRLPMKFQAFTTQRCIIRQLCLLWLISTALVLYPSLSTTVKVNSGCFAGFSGYNLVLIPPLSLLMFVIYISILLKLRQRQSRSRPRFKEVNVNSEHPSEPSLKKLNDANVSDDVVSIFNAAQAIDTIDTEQQMCITDKDKWHSPDMQDITKPVLRSNTSTDNPLNTQSMASSTSQLASDIVPHPLMPKIRPDMETDLQSTSIPLVQPSTPAIGNSPDLTVKTSVIGSKFLKNIHTSPKQKRPSIDQRNKKAILLVLAIYLIMFGCHSGLLYAISYASIYNLGQEYIYNIGDGIVLPYVIHTCITPILQLRFNDVVRKGFPTRFHQTRSASP